jgi:hypothetical protein
MANYIKHMNLHRPIVAKRFVVKIKEKGSSFSQWWNGRMDEFANWAETELQPQVNTYTTELNDLSDRGFDWSRPNPPGLIRSYIRRKLREWFS